MKDRRIDGAFADLRRSVPEVSASEAPVLARTSDLLRAYDGRWWRAVEHPGDAEHFPHAVGDSGVLTGPCPAWAAILHHANGTDRVRPGGPRTHVSLGSATRLPSPDLSDAAMAKALAAARAATEGHAILVDGALHCACEGPVLVLSAGTAGWDGMAFTSAANAHLYGGTALFSPRRRDEALDLAKRWLRKREFANWVDLPAWAPVRDDPASLAGEVAHDLLSACQSAGIGLLDPEAIERVADLMAMAETRAYDLLEVRRCVEDVCALTRRHGPYLGKPNAPPRDVQGMTAVSGSRIHRVSSFLSDRLSYEALTSPEEEAALSSLSLS